MNKKTIILAGGGTGGHAVPVLELYKYITKTSPEITVKIIGGGSEIERKILGRNKDYVIIPAGKLRRQFSFKNFIDFFRLLAGVMASIKIIIKLKPEIIFSKGGFVGLPVVFAARMLGIPYIIHESDIEMGITNKIAQKKAAKVFTGFPLENYNKSENWQYSGQIMRDSFKNNLTAHRSHFSFSENKPVILITGGSQGAMSINKALKEILQKLLINYNVIHQTGKDSVKDFKEIKEKLQPEIKSSYYLTDLLREEDGHDLMVEAINLADLVIARAGSSIAELAVKGKAMIIVPYKYAAGDHQTKNALFLEKKHAAVVINDDKLTGDLLFEKINEIFNDAEKKISLEQNALSAFLDSGLQTVGDYLITLAKKKEV